MSRASSDWEAQDKDKVDQHPRLSDALPHAQPGLDNVFTQRGCPPHGAKAICGRRPRMEDAYTAVPFLLEVSSTWHVLLNPHPGKTFFHIFQGACL